MLDPSQQYDRWDVIGVKVYRDDKDNRPESWHFEPGTPIRIVEKLTTQRARWEWMKRCVHESRLAMEAKGLTNGCVEIDPIELYWTEEEKELTFDQINTLRQGNLYDNDALREALAERVPWQFRLKFRESKTGLTGDGKVLAWSYYQGYLRHLRDLKNEKKALEVTAERIRKSIFNETRTIFAIFGTHIHWKTWMISSVYYVDTEVTEKNVGQGSLF